MKYYWFEIFQYIIHKKYSFLSSNVLHYVPSQNLRNNIFAGCIPINTQCFIFYIQFQAACVHFDYSLRKNKKIAKIC